MKLHDSASAQGILSYTPDPLFNLQADPVISVTIVIAYHPFNSNQGLAY